MILVLGTCQVSCGEGEVDSVRIVGGELDGSLGAGWRLGEGTIVLGAGDLGRLSTFCFLRLDSNLSIQLVGLSSRNRMNT